jgi:glycerol-3-phosphate acyltransferase PlsY
MYPVWLRGHGGKGVATTLGACLAWVPAVAAVAVAVFIVTVMVTRAVSAGSVLAAMIIGPLGVVWGAPRPVVIGAFIAGGMVVYRHRGNLTRLAAGTERRIGAPRTGG